VLADLDGVVYAGAGALPHAVESLNRARDGRRLGYITNNASRTDASVAERVAAAMKDAYQDAGVIATTRVTRPGPGAHVFDPDLPITTGE